MPFVLVRCRTTVGLGVVENWLWKNEQNHEIELISRAGRLCIARDGSGRFLATSPSDCGIERPLWAPGTQEKSIISPKNRLSRQKSPKILGVQQISVGKTIENDEKSSKIRENQPKFEKIRNFENCPNVPNGFQTVSGDSVWHISRLYLVKTSFKRKTILAQFESEIIPEKS